MVVVRVWKVGGGGGGENNVKHHRHDLLIVLAFSFTEQNYFLVSDILTK